MALEWSWSRRVGEMEIARGEKNFTVSLYQGNAFLIALHEYKGEDGEDMYAMYTFFVDKQHAKNCFGLAKGKTNIFDDNNRIVRVRLNKRLYSYTKELTEMLVRAFDEIQIEIYSEGVAE